jgi:pyruvate kinase
MNCARINCAHDDAESWAKMIHNVQTANAQLKKNCKITMDLGGPKLRTGPMQAGPKVIHISPTRDDRGRVTNPARVWIAPPDVPLPADMEEAVHIPVPVVLFQKIKRGNKIHFRDSRNKKCTITIDRQDGAGKWGLCSDSAYIETGTELILHKEKQTGEAVSRVGELLPKEQFITLFQGDTLVLHKDPRPGEPAVFDEAGTCLAPAHISCTLPEIFADVQAGEPVYFDDGKIEGVITAVSPEEIEVKILQARDRGSKLKADKGINLPESNLQLSGLTAKDKADLAFVAEHTDAINFSFVNTAKDVEDLQAFLQKLQAKPGIILKIETQQGFANLPAILLTAMRNYPVGVMIARGDLAIETGWKNFASIQQEIIRVCAAAHIPNVWATQVLENLAKKGTPSRAEITDAALATQAECVMLNKGYYIHKAVKMLDKILRRMQRFQQKTVTMLPKLDQADQLILSHKKFDIS